MAMDTQQKRMSAMNLTQPWRGPLIDPTEAGFDAGARAAADYFYSGVYGAGPVATVVSFTKSFIGEIQQMGDSGIMDSSMGQS